MKNGNKSWGMMLGTMKESWQKFEIVGMNNHAG